MKSIDCPEPLNCGPITETDKFSLFLDAYSETLLHPALNPAEKHSGLDEHDGLRFPSHIDINSVIRPENIEVSHQSKK